MILFRILNSVNIAKSPLRISNIQGVLREVLRQASKTPRCVKSRTTAAYKTLFFKANITTNPTYPSRTNSPNLAV